MKIFGKKKVEEKKRTLDDMFTPKGESANEEQADESENESVENVENVQDDKNSKPKEIKIESKEESSFNALTCFGWSESRTPKWLIKCAHFWYWAISFLWFIFGAMTFAPIIFIQKKIDVVFKDKIKSFVVAIIIYALALGLIILLITTRNADKVDEVVKATETAIA